MDDADPPDRVVDRLAVGPVAGAGRSSRQVGAQAQRDQLVQQRDAQQSAAAKPARRMNRVLAALRLRAST